MNLRYGGNILETTRRLGIGNKCFSIIFRVSSYLFLSFVFGFVQGEQNVRHKLVCRRDPLPLDVWSERQEYGGGVNSWQHQQ